MSAFFLHRKMQLFLSVYVGEKGREKYKTCKIKVIGETQHHYLHRKLLDVLSEQHKSVTET